MFERKQFSVSKHYLNFLLDKDLSRYTQQEIDDLNHFDAYNLIVNVYYPDDLINLEKRYCQISRRWEDDVVSIWCDVIPEELMSDETDANYMPESGS